MTLQSSLFADSDAPSIPPPSLPARPHPPGSPSAAGALVDRAWRAGLAPEPAVSVSEWADANRLLPSTSSEPGRWRTGRTPYLRDIMDALSTHSPFERVVFMKGAQIGGTEAGLNWLAYIIANAPGVALLVMPSLDMVRRNTRTRIDPMLETCPTLRARVAPARAKDSNNTAFSKGFPGGQLVMTGANSAAGLRSTPARYIFFDEVDGFPPDADGEGDPVDLAIKRAATYRGRRKVYMVSTPTIKGLSRIEAAFAESDQRRYCVPCLHCGDMAPIAWSRIKWPDDAPERAFLACDACGGVMEERDKPALLAAGAWRATADGDRRTAGFHLSSLYSPFETWAEIAAEHLRVRKDPARLQVFVNTALAETWEEREGETLDDGALAARRENWGERAPAAVKVLTAGIDVQIDRIEAQIVGWGEGEEAWVLDYRIIYGDPAAGAVWRDLDAFLLTRFPREGGGDLDIRAVALDTGGAHTAQAYEFVRTRLRRRIWGVKGRGGPGVPAWPLRASKGKGGAPIFIVGVDSLKSAIMARLKIEGDGAGAARIHFNARLDARYFEQLTAEAPVVRYAKGRPVREWRLVRSDRRNEALDTFVYSLAALRGLYVQGFRLAGTPATGARPTPLATASRVIRSRWLGNQG